MDEKLFRTLKLGLAMAFAWGALVAIASKIEIKHSMPASPWIEDH